MNTAAEIGTVIAILAIIVAVARRAFLQPTMSIGGVALMISLQTAATETKI